jgi:hypothetical protein
MPTSPKISPLLQYQSKYYTLITWFEQTYHMMNEKKWNTNMWFIKCISIHYKNYQYSNTDTVIHLTWCLSGQQNILNFNSNMCSTLCQLVSCLVWSKIWRTHFILWLIFLVLFILPWVQYWMPDLRYINIWLHLLASELQNFKSDFQR